MNAMRRFLIDTDTASDDAVALVMALKHPDVQVEAITVVAGNVPLPQAVQNALYTVEQCAKDVTVVAGAAKPLTRALETAQNVHGQDGMGDIGLPLSGHEPTPGHAVDVILETINRNPGEITLVSLGPLTNIALAVSRDPGIASKVARYVMMGGVGDGWGNVTPVSEYNLWCDPEAAKIVFQSGMPIEMVGWDISYKYAVFGPKERERLLAVGTPLAKFCVDIQATLDEFVLTETKLEGFDLPDPIAMAVALEPGVATRSEKLFVTIETEGYWSRGQTIVDHMGFTRREKNVQVVLEANRARFIEMLHEAVR
jgi:purine nucleosidase